MAFEYNVVTPNSPDTSSDFCIAELFKDGESTLLINYSNITPSELSIICTGDISVGMVVDNDDIILYWMFGDEPMEIITPFDARGYNTANEEITLGKGAVNIHLVERTKSLLIASRPIDLPIELVKELTSAVEHQLSGNAKPMNGHHEKWDTWPIPKLKQFIPKFYKI